MLLSRRVHFPVGREIALRGRFPLAAAEGRRGCAPRFEGRVIMAMPPNPFTAAAIRSSSVATTTASTPRAEAVRR